MKKFLLLFLLIVIRNLTVHANVFIKHKTNTNPIEVCVGSTIQLIDSSSDIYIDKGITFYNRFMNYSALMQYNLCDTNTIVINQNNSLEVYKDTLTNKVRYINLIPNSGISSSNGKASQTDPLVPI